jgi:hypothetical protein
MIRRTWLFALATMLAVVAASCHHAEYDEAGITGGRSLAMEKTSSLIGPAPRD